MGGRGVSSKRAARLLRRGPTGALRQARPRAGEDASRGEQAHLARTTRGFGSGTRTPHRWPAPSHGPVQGPHPHRQAHVLCTRAHKATATPAHTPRCAYGGYSTPKPRRPPPLCLRSLRCSTQTANPPLGSRCFPPPSALRGPRANPGSRTPLRAGRVRVFPLPAPLVDIQGYAKPGPCDTKTRNRRGAPKQIRPCLLLPH